MLTNINDRLTPSAPTEITFGAQPIAVGRKFTTLFGHMAAVPGVGLPYGVRDVINVGDPTAARQEVDALAGVGSQIGKMAEAFVKANTQVTGSRNLPAFRVVLIPNAELGFGPNDEAIEAVKLLRSDMFVNCYPTSNAGALAKLVALCQLISGVDRDLNGQFGSFVLSASLDALVTQLAYGTNKREAINISFPDTNTAAVVGVTGDTTLGSPTITNVSSVVGLYKGAQVTGAGIPAGSVVDSFNANSITLNFAATATAAAVALGLQNVVSQAVEIVAAASAAAMMQSPFPYNPLQGVAIGGLIPPRKAEDRIIIDPSGSSEAALQAGLAPLYTAPGDVVSFIRTRTSYTTLPDNVTAVTDYFDWQQLVVLYDFREVCYQVTQNPPFNNNPGGTKASVQKAARLKDEVLRNAQIFEDNEAFQNVKESAKLFVVQPSATSKGRFDYRIPVEVVPGLHVIAGNIVAVSDLTTFSF